MTKDQAYRPVPEILSAASLLRLPQVLSVIPVSRSTWWNRVRSGDFPQPVKLGPRTTAWRASDIADLLARLSDQNED
ncbi:MAG: helix-turn-helix transcriptional regulator [Desulfovibrio sp.]